VNADLPPGNVNVDVACPATTDVDVDVPTWRTPRVYWGAFEALKPQGPHTAVFAGRPCRIAGHPMSDAPVNFVTTGVSYITPVVPVWPPVVPV